MVMIIGAFIVSMIPAVLLFFWLKDKVRKPEDENYKKNCVNAMLNGFLSVLLVILFSGVLSISAALLGFKDGSSIWATMFHDFIAIAFSEELAKTLMFRKTLNNSESPYTWQDMAAFMVIVSLGFEILESIVYAFGTSPGQILVRGILVMHGGFGFIEGYYYGKAKYTGKKWYAVLGFALAWLMHGAYDFGLSESFAALGDWTPFLSVSLAGVSLIILVVMVIFFAKKNKKEQYTVPLQ